MQNRNLVLALLLSLLLFSIPGTAQNNTSSPYSRFGIGDIASQGFGRNKALGGTGIALRSNKTLNNLNPASYTAMDSMSFILEFGVKAGFSQFKTNLRDNSQNNSDFNFDYLAFSFPITKWWGSSMGILPLSDVGYEINTRSTVDVDGEPVETLFTLKGEGGLSKAYWSNGFKLHKNLSVGVTMGYVFGSLNLNKELEFFGANFSKMQREDKSVVKDFLWDFGVQYHKQINSHYDLNLGATYRGKTKLQADFESKTQNITPFLNNQGDAQGKIDIIESIDEKRDFELPQTYGMGFAVTKDKKLTLAFDYNHQKWSNTKFLGKSDTLVNSNNYALGLEYVPNANSIRSYFQRIVYRIGGHYTDTYLKIRDHQLKDYGVSIGAGFPLRKNYINVAFEMGRRGSLNNNLIREDYGKISVNFTLFEHWFVKRKFD